MWKMEPKLHDSQWQGQWDTAEENATVLVIKPEYGAELESQIKAKSYQQIPMEPDHEKARTPSGRCGEQKDHHLLP